MMDEDAYDTSRKRVHTLKRERVDRAETHADYLDTLDRLRNGADMTVEEAYQELPDQMFADLFNPEDDTVTYTDDTARIDEDDLLVYGMDKLAERDREHDKWFTRLARRLCGPSEDDGYTGMYGPIGSINYLRGKQSTELEDTSLTELTDLKQEVTAANSPYDAGRRTVIEDTFEDTVINHVLDNYRHNQIEIIGSDRTATDTYAETETDGGEPE